MSSEKRIESKKEAMIDKAEARLDSIDAEVKRLKAKADEADADARLELNEEMAEIENTRKAAADKLETLREAGENATDDIVEGFESAWKTLSGSVEKAIARFG